MPQVLGPLEHVLVSKDTKTSSHGGACPRFPRRKMCAKLRQTCEPHSNRWLLLCSNPSKSGRGRPKRDSCKHGCCCFVFLLLCVPVCVYVLPAFGPFAGVSPPMGTQVEKKHPDSKMMLHFMRRHTFQEKHSSDLLGFSTVSPIALVLGCSGLEHVARVSIRAMFQEKFQDPSAQC